MSVEENTALIRRFVQEVQDKRNLVGFEEYFSPDFINHTEIPGLTPDRDGARQLHEGLFAAFPDFRATIQTQVAQGDKVVTHKTFTGTHRGDFMGVPATGNEVSFEVIDIVVVVNGKVTEHWAVVDQLTLMQQLGAIPG